MTTHPARTAPRPRFRTGSPWALLVAVAGVLASAAVIGTGHWRKGTMVFAASVLLAGLMRMVLPERLAGQLAVRAKWLDCLILLGAGAALVILVMVVPHSPPA